MRFTGPPHQLLEAGRSGRVARVAPEYVLREGRRILLRKFALSDAAIDSGLAELPVTVLPNPPVTQVVRAQLVIHDRADAPVLAAAWAGAAEAIVTGDAHFFTPAVQAHMLVLTPREALGVILSGEAESGTRQP
jgi:predicted nucleic acid-binding protein